jgi:hypothetical protein
MIKYPLGDFGTGALAARVPFTVFDRAYRLRPLSSPSIALAAQTVRLGFI